MRFSDPLWLAAGFIAVIVLIWMWQRYDARQHAALARFVSAHLRDQLTRSMSRVGRRVQRGLFLTALIGLFVTLAGPLAGFRWEQISRRGNEVIFAIDTSRSMLTPDVKPNRLTRAKLAIDDFAKRMDGDAVGIVAFAGTAFLTCPVTLDYGAFHESLGAIDTNTIPRGGTNIANAIQAAQAALRRRPGGDKILILVTDGEDLEGNALEAARSAGREGLKIYTVGVGTPAGDLIPQLGGGFVKDEAGTFVKSRLDESGLKAIAEAAGGIYAPLGAQGEGLDLIFNTALGSIAKHEIASRRQKIYTPRYQWPLAASLATLLASLLVGTRRRRAVRRAAVSAAVMSGLAVLMVLPMRATRAEGETQGAPIPTERDSKKPLLEYNAGTAAYRAGEFPQAAQAFQQSISHVPSSEATRLSDQQDAYYNLGNSLYRAGQRTEKSSAQDTLQKWNDAVKAYETALQLRANDADAKFNRDFVKRKIDELNQQQNQDQNKNNQNKDQNQKNNQDQQQNKGQQQDKSAKNNDPKQGQGQPPPQGQGQPPPQGQGQPPPQGQGQPPPQGQGQPPPQPPPGQGQPPPQAQQPQSGGGEPQNSGDDARAADNQRLPGQMSREEARELLDSVKGDEKRPPGTPLAQRNAVDPPEKPYKNW
ncbi:MAG TPA: VWA domain-containing protein [Steroidobacteraceae bacterium]